MGVGVQVQSFKYHIWVLRTWAAWCLRYSPGCWTTRTSL
jgi:hypothetical protein